MDTFLLSLLLVFLLLIGIPLGLAYLIDWFIRKRDYDRRLRLLALIPIILLAYFGYTAIYPGEDFYKTDFKEVTGVEFPENGRFLYKTASFPDHFGDYTSVVIVQVGKDFYKILPNKLIDHRLRKTKTKVSSSEFEKALSYVEDEKIVKEYKLIEGGGVNYYVGFLSDKKTLIVKRHSW